MKKILQYSIDNKLKHIPSALSQYSYLKYVLPMLKQDYNICIGKPFGSQAYYLPWLEMGYIKENQKLSYGIKHDELEFVNFSEETLGNALGVASGVALISDKPTYCNISDGALQMGATLEALQFIGKHEQNILLNIDFNGVQLTGKTLDNIKPDIFEMRDILSNYGWNVFINDIKRWEDNKQDPNKIIKEQLDYFLESKKPVIQLFLTTKGYGVKEMEDDPVYWHYRELNNINDVTIK